MSNLYCKDFHHRLTELSNWQIEQQKKIKALQETQKKLLTMEQYNILSASVTELSNKACTSTENYLSNADDETINTKNNRDYYNVNNKNLEEDMCNAQLKLQQNKLQGPALLWFNGDCSLVPKDEACTVSNEKIYKLDKNKSTSPKRFLRRGDGLARFRMSLADFKGPPKIYKEKKIRTYVNNKSSCAVKKLNNQNVKSSKQTIVRGNHTSKISSRSLSIPVNIYVSDNKTKVGHKKKTEAKQVIALEDQQKKNDNAHSQQSTEQYLKFCSTTLPDSSREKVNCHGEVKIPYDSSSSKIEVCYDLDTENKKDDNELKIFEILEQKINDNSFCSSSSLVDKLMEHSLSCTPSNPSSKEIKLCADSCTQEGKSSSSKPLSDELMTKIEEEVNEIELSQSSKQKTLKPSENCIGLQDGRELVRFGSITGRDSEIGNGGIKDVGNSDNEKFEIEKSKFDCSQPYKVNKTLLEKYVKDFKMLKINFSKAVHGMEESKEEMSQKDLNNEEKEEFISQREIELKLQRKGLQDNVKHLMNWENSSRKKLTKRNLKKMKSKPKKVDKTKTIENDQTEKITFNSALLKARLDELEKEIEIFRRENKILEKLQKECSVERLKLAKERKEFEKQKLEEKEKLKANIIEDRKKLQKEKVVFEKYCKQIKNQPNRQEREEIANLKKEIENLRETLAAKESRWGSSQARLRNQIKVLEKENARLKAESDEYKKLPIKKVTFENEGGINTKIINAVNSEMNKLKPTLIKNLNGSLLTKNKCLSARVGRNLERKPIRRIKSDPNMKKLGLTDLINDFPVHDKASISVSKDSGIEANEPLCIALPQSDKILPTNTSKFSKIGEEENLKCRIEGSYVNAFGELSDRGSDVSEGSSHESIVSFTEQAVFDCKETKDLDFRHLDRSNILQKTSDHFESPSSIPAANLNYDKAREISEIEMNFKKDGRSIRSQPHTADYFEKKGVQNKSDLVENLYCCEDYLIENKIEENKIRERTLEDGVKEICYPNGNVKKIYPGNKIEKMVYYNGDIKETNALEGSEKYYYAESKTWHTTYRDGFEVLEFPNGQTERRHANGATEISFPNGCVRYCDGFGSDEWRFLDGTVIKTNEKGHKILLMSNGQKEIHTKEFKRREYPDGTVKMLYSDGTQETRYACGRVRLKDKAGNLIMDSEGIS